MDVADGGDHRAADGRAGERSREAGDEQRATAGLGHAGRDRIAPARFQPERLEEPTGPLEPMAAEPAEQLLSAMADEQPADEHAQDETPKLHVKRMSGAPSGQTSGGGASGERRGKGVTGRRGA
jgi:hypothetical protein